MVRPNASVRRSARGLDGRAGEPPFESLEPRLALFAGPMVSSFPADALLDPANGVVRFNTVLGNIDIELYDATPSASTALANFRSYLTAGRLDETFFHKSVYSPGATTGQYLAGGRYRLLDGAGLSQITDFAPVPNALTASNLAWTIALAPVTSTTSFGQFVINLTDNPSFNAAPQFAVFGRVLPSSRPVVTAIASLTARDLRAQLGAGDPLLQATTLFDRVPTLSSFNPAAGATEWTLAKINDAEQIKPPGRDSQNNPWGYFAQAATWPFGIRGDKIIEFLDIAAQDSSTLVQVVARYQGGQRDAVIFSTVLSANQRFRVTLSNAQFPAQDLVRLGERYAVEVRATRAFSAAMTRTGRPDGNIRSMQGETLFDAGAQNLAGDALRAWSFPGGLVGSDQRAIIGWSGQSDQRGTVTVTLLADGFAARTYNFALSPFRRGSADLHTLAADAGAPGGAIPAGTRYAVRVTSDVPIIAGLARTVSVTTPGGGTYNTGDLEQGTLGGRQRGFLAGARIQTGGQAAIDLVATNFNSGLVVLRFTFWLGNGSQQVFQNISLNANTGQQRAYLDLTAVAGLPRDQEFSISYELQSGVGSFAATYVATRNGDTVSTPFSGLLTPEAYFADGFLNPSLTGADAMDETVSLFNPFTRADATLFYNVFYQFSDGTVITIPTGGSGVGTLAPRARVDIRTQNLSTVVAKINSGAQFRNYSIRVVSVAFSPAFSEPGMPSGLIVASIARSWPRNTSAIMSLGSLQGLSSQAGSIAIATDNYTVLDDL